MFPGSEKSLKSWNPDIQAVVVATIKKQYAALDLDASSAINLLSTSPASTVTTGHQLQLFGGPAFLHYKTIATIRKARALSLENGTPVVPIFWMATEDHDFAEISSVWGRDSKFVWNYPSEVEKLPVGVLPLTGLRDVAEAWLSEANLSADDSATILSCLAESESRGESYAQFFNRLMHAWYGDSGLIVIDAAAPELKALALNLFSDELHSRGIASAVRSTSARLELKGIKPKAHIRDINLFHIAPGSPRIGIVDPASHSTTPPEHLSPGVLLRPLYQELLLPNQIVVLGPGEAAYWQQLDDAFELKGFAKPELHLRDHVLWLRSRNSDFADMTDWPSAKVLQSEFIDSRIRELFSEQFSVVESSLEAASASMSSMATEIDKSLDGARGAAEAAMQKAWKVFLKKAKRSVRRLESEALSEIDSFVGEIIRDGSPQDRWANLHVLSASMGGFVNSREKLLETNVGLEPLKIVFLESD